jgi:acyl-CoA thioester hydrolase
MSFHFQKEIELDWADLDLFGHVNNVAYFKFIQSTRVEFLDLMGIQTLEQGTKSFIVAATSCDFIRPISFPGKMFVKLKVGDIGTTSIQFHYELSSVQNLVVARAKDVIVFFDYNQQSKIPVPDNFKSSRA